LLYLVASRRVRSLRGPGLEGGATPVRHSFLATARNPLYSVFSSSRTGEAGRSTSGSFKLGPHDLARRRSWTSPSCHAGSPRGESFRLSRVKPPKPKREGGTSSTSMHYSQPQRDCRRFGNRLWDWKGRKTMISRVHHEHAPPRCSLNAVERRHARGLR